MMIQTPPSLTDFSAASRRCRRSVLALLLERSKARTLRVRHYSRRPIFIATPPGRGQLAVFPSDQVKIRSAYACARLFCDAQKGIRGWCRFIVRRPAFRARVRFLPFNRQNNPADHEGVEGSDLYRRVSWNQRQPASGYRGPGRSI